MTETNAYHNSNPKPESPIILSLYIYPSYYAA